MVTGRVLVVVLAMVLPAVSASAASTGDLVAGLANADPELRLQAIEALGESGDGAAVDPLVAVVRSSTAEGLEVMAAIDALGKLGDSRAVGPLIAVVERDFVAHKGYAMAAIPALGELGDARAVPVLVQALTKRSDDWLGRESAAWALGQIGSPEAVPSLVNAAWMADTRSNAVAALARIGDVRGAEVLVSALASGEDEEAQQAAIAGLVRIGAPSVAFLADGLEAASGEFKDPVLRRNARQVLEQIDTPEARNLLQKIR